MDITTIFDQVVLVSLDISIWSGRKKLQAKDLHLADSQIPPSELASIGSKKIVDPKTIAPLDSARRAAEKACLEVGFKFMKGYCIPQNRAKELSVELSKIKVNFNMERVKFINNYTNNIDNWINRHPAWEDAIRKAVTPIEVVENRIGFRVQFTRIGQVDDSLGVNDDSQDTVENIPSALVHEIAKESEKLWAQSFSGRTTVTQKILRPIRRMRDKLKGLSFIDARIYPIVDRIDDSLSSMPKAGKIMGNNLNALFGIMSFLQDPHLMLKYGEDVISGNIDDSKLFTSTQQNLLIDDSDSTEVLDTEDETNETESLKTSETQEISEELEIQAVTETSDNLDTNEQQDDSNTSNNPVVYDDSEHSDEPEDLNIDHNSHSESSNDTQTQGWFY